MAPVNFTLLVGAGLSVLLVSRRSCWCARHRFGGSWFLVRAGNYAGDRNRAIGLGRICAIRRRCTAPTPVVAGVASVVSAIAI
jgi:hypothetical protein